jgi:hypothetical protein
MNRAQELFGNNLILVLGGGNGARFAPRLPQGRQAGKAGSIPQIRARAGASHKRLKTRRL